MSVKSRAGGPQWARPGVERSGLAIDWTMFDAVLPGGRRLRHQVLRIAVARRGRALPLLQVAYDRDRLPAARSPRPPLLARLGAPREPPPHRVPAEPWYLAASLGRAEQAVAWYWQRGWIEQSFRDSTSRFGLKRVRVGGPVRRSRLVLGLTLALAWLTLAALPEVGALPPGWPARVAQWGRASLLTLALALLDHLRDLPLACLPQPSPAGGYA